MRAKFLIALSMIGPAWSGPARRDCGLEKCYSAVNECGAKYGGCWTECAGGVMDMPTFTAPLCPTTIDPVVNSDTRIPVQTSNSEQDSASSPDVGATELPSITPPPFSQSTDIILPTPSASGPCQPLWLCIDYVADCGDTKQMYGGCYDTCTSIPPIESPPCSLSSSSTPSELPTSIATPAPGAVFTKKPAANDTDSATEDNKAMIMAEMPASSDLATAAQASNSVPDPDAGEFRVAQVQPNEPEFEGDLVQAPAQGGSLRANAIAAMKANPNRVAKTPNVACDGPWCKEVQLGSSS